jgi:hypothetical protein
LGGTVVVKSTATGAIDPINYTTEQYDTAFKNLFGREAKVGEGVQIVLGNKTQGNISAPGGTNIPPNNYLYEIIEKTSTIWFVVGRDKIRAF